MEWNTAPVSNFYVCDEATVVLSDTAAVSEGDSGSADILPIPELPPHRFSKGLKLTLGGELLTY